MALKNGSKNKSYMNSKKVIGGSALLKPIEYDIVKPKNDKQIHTNIIQQSYNNIQELELLERQLNFLVNDVSSIVLKN